MAFLRARARDRPLALALALALDLDLDLDLDQQAGGVEAAKGRTFNPERIGAVLLTGGRSTPNHGGPSPHRLGTRLVC